MAILATTAGIDRLYRKDAVKSLFESALAVTSTANTFYQGDLMCFDTGTKAIRAVAATSDGATFIGVSPVSVISGVLLGPYNGLATSAAAAPQDYQGPMYGAGFLMKLHVGDAFTLGQKVYLSNGDDCQTVSSTDPGDHNYVGIFVGPSAIASAVAGQQAVIKIGNRYPYATGADLNW